MAQKALYSILAFLLAFGFFQKAVSVFLEYQSTKIVPYSELK